MSGRTPADVWPSRALLTRPATRSGLDPERWRVAVRAIEGGLIDDLLAQWFDVPSVPTGSPEDFRLLGEMAARISRVVEAPIDFAEKSTWWRGSEGELRAKLYEEQDGGFLELFSVKATGEPIPKRMFR